MDTACAVSCGLADFELRRLRPACARFDLVAGTTCRRAALSGRPYGGDCLPRFLRRADRDADLWRGRLRPNRLPTLQGAFADFCQKLGREYHRFLERVIRRTLLRAVYGSSEGPPLEAGQPRSRSKLLKSAG